MSYVHLLADFFGRTSSPALHCAEDDDCKLYCPYIYRYPTLPCAQGVTTSLNVSCMRLLATSGKCFSRGEVCCSARGFATDRSRSCRSPALALSLIPRKVPHLSLFLGRESGLRPRANAVVLKPSPLTPASSRVFFRGYDGKAMRSAGSSFCVTCGVSLIARSMSFSSCVYGTTLPHLCCSSFRVCPSFPVT